MPEEKKCDKKMAEEKFFSVEETLLDLLGFAKKLSLTIVDSLFRPWRLVITTHLIIQHGKQHKEPDEEIEVGRRYISHFLYFVICVLIFLSYFKGLKFNSENNLTQPLDEVVRNTNTYLTETSITEKLLLYFPVIVMVYLGVAILAFLLQKKLAVMLGMSEKNAQFFFKRLVYYVLGANLLLFVLPIYFRKLTSDSVQLWLNYGIMYGYYIYILLVLCFPIYDRANTIPQRFSFKYVKKIFTHLGNFKGWEISILVCLFSLIFMFSLRQVFIFEMKLLGYSEYSSLVKAEPLNKESAWEFKTIVLPDSSIRLTTELVITNRWDRGIVLRPDSSISFQFIYEKNKKGIIFFHVLQSDSTGKSDLVINLASNESEYIKISSAPLSKGQFYDLQKQIVKDAKGTYQIIYYPMNTFEKERRNNIQFRLKPY